MAPSIIPAEDFGDDATDDGSGGLVYHPGLSVSSLIRSAAPFTDQG